MPRNEAPRSVSGLERMREALNAIRKQLGQRQDFKILYEITLGSNHSPTGRTRHYRGAQLLPPPHNLRITQKCSDAGYYLIYYDEAGREQTDTYHESLEGAFEQARFEFGTDSAEWRAVALG